MEGWIGRERELLTKAENFKVRFCSDQILSYRSIYKFHPSSLVFCLLQYDGWYLTINPIETERTVHNDQNNPKHQHPRLHPRRPNPPQNPPPIPPKPHHPNLCRPPRKPRSIPHIQIQPKPPPKPPRAKTKSITNRKNRTKTTTTTTKTPPNNRPNPRQRQHPHTPPKYPLPAPNPPKTNLPPHLPNLALQRHQKPAWRVDRLEPRGEPSGLRG